MSRSITEQGDLLNLDRTQPDEGAVLSYATKREGEKDMSTVFTASNGVTVAVAPDSTGGVFTVTTKGGPGEVPVLAELYYDELTALREFHQHENDVRLGRWRSKVLTDYVVYERGGGWLVLNEASGNTKHYSHRNHAEAGGTLLSQVAREFFAAHRIWPASEATA